MSIDKRWFPWLAIAVGAAAGAVVALRSHRREQRRTRDLVHTDELKSWENEGGNLAPAAVPPAGP